MNTSQTFLLLVLLFHGPMIFVHPAVIASQDRNDSTEISELITLSDQYLNIDYPQAKEYAHQALILADKSTDPPSIAASLSQWAKVHWYNGDYKEAIQANEEAISIREESGDVNGLARNYNNLALVYYYMADYPNAIFYHNRSFDLYDELEDQAGMAKVLSHIGLVYHKQANYPKAIEYMLESARIRENTPDYDANIYDITGSGPAFRDSSYYLNELEYLFKQLESFTTSSDTHKLALLYHSIGLSYYYLGNFKETVSYLKEHIKRMESINQMPYWNDLGKAYCKLGYYDSAIYAHQQALKDATIKGTRISKATSLGLLGDVFYNSNQNEKAAHYYKETLELETSMGNRLEIARNCRKLAETCMALSQYDQAMDYASKCLNIGQEINAGNIIRDALRLQSDLLGMNGEFEKAYLVEKRYIQLQDSLASGETQYKLAMVQLQYDITKRIKEIEILDQKNQIQSAQLKTQSIIIFSSGGFLLLILLLALVLYTRYKQKQRLFTLLSRQKEQITEQNLLLEKGNKEKEVLLGEIHHRVKNNLQLISSLLSIQSFQMSDDKARQAVLEGQNRVMAMGLIHENLYKFHDFGSVDIREYLKNLTENLIESFGYELNKFSLEIDIENIHLDIDSAIPIGLISNELITNSLKYGCGVMDTPWLKIILNHNDGMLKYVIKDNGPGMKYIKNNDKFGLRLVNELTKKLNGSMTINGLSGTEICIEIRNFKLAS